MKILMTCLLDWDRPSAGRVHFGALAREFRAAGHELVGLLSTREGSDLFDKLIRIPRFNESLLGQACRSSAHLIALARALRRERPDLLYYRFRSCSPAVVRVARGTAPRTRILTELNNWPSDLLAVSGYARPFAQLAHWGQLTCARASDAVRALTHSHRDLLVQHGVPADRVIVAGTGVDLDGFRPADRDAACRANGLDPALRYVGFVGHLTRWQGVDVLLRAAPAILSRHREARLLIAGEGPQAENLARWAAELGCADRVTFLGAVPHERVPSLIHACDVCIGPLVRERSGQLTRSPMKLREYAACGKPSIAVRVGGLEELEQAGASWLADPGSAASVAELVTRLLADDRARAQAGAAARRFAEQNFSWARIAAILLARMEELVR
jgi:glycosyltransferase involved in cell wall biosynthesis